MVSKLSDILVVSMVCVGLFFSYLSSGNPGILISFLGGMGVLVSELEIIKFSRITYYVTLFCIFLLQTAILINNYLFKMTFLQNNYQYGILVFAVVLYIINIILLLKPNIINLGLDS